MDSFEKQDLEIYLMWMEGKKGKWQGGDLVSGFNAGNVNFNGEIKTYSRLVIQGYDNKIVKFVFVIHSLEVGRRLGFIGLELSKYRFEAMSIGRWILTR